VDEAKSEDFGGISRRGSAVRNNNFRTAAAESSGKICKKLESSEGQGSFSEAEESAAKNSQYL